MKGWRSKIPRTSTLLAFEAVARLGSVGEAAAERRTSLSAISRHIRTLEESLGVKLFERSGRGIVPTEGGKEYFRAVQASIYCLHTAASGLHTGTVTVTVACTQEVSHYLLLPVFPALKRSLGRNVRLRILNCDYDMLDLVLPTGVDVIFDYSESHADKGSVRLLDEKIVPVASPALARRFERILGRASQPLGRHSQAGGRAAAPGLGDLDDLVSGIWLRPARGPGRTVRELPVYARRGRQRRRHRHRLGRFRKRRFALEPSLHDRRRLEKHGCGALRRADAGRIPQ